MVAYSFKRQFIGPIQCLNKAQTMRNERKRHARPGETLQLYTGMRTKQCMLIGTAICAAVSPVRIDFKKVRVDIAGRIIGHGASRKREFMADLALDRFALDDGFDNWGELCAFWAREHDAIKAWSGVLIRWTNFKLPQSAKG